MKIMILNQAIKIMISIKQ